MTQLENGGPMVSALDGITVLDLTQGVAGAIATMFLCDNGARVVRVESPGDANARQHPGYRIWDRGKESVLLDLSTNLDEFDKLVCMADVLVESFSPSSIHRDNIGYDRLSSLNPGLVHCSITAYGEHGPLKDEPPVDQLVMARIGLLSPPVRDDPIYLVHPLPSIGAGLMAAQGIVASLVARERTGKGRKVETSLLAGALLYVPKFAGENVETRPTLRGSLSGGVPFYSVMECADGEWIHLGCIHEGFVDRAAKAMGISEIVADPRYGSGWRPKSEDARRYIFDAVAKVIKTRPYAEWEKVFEEVDVPYARACTTEEAMANSQVLHNEMVVELHDPETGPVKQMGLPIKLSETPGRVKGPSVAPGKDTTRVLDDLKNTPLPKPQHNDARPSVLDLPLKGIRVLEITNVLAGPTAGKMLADLGAEIVKFEPLNGAIGRGPNAGFLYLNSGRRGISANTRTPEGKEVARRLLSQSDVLLANMRPGATERMGIGPDVLKEVNPNLIETHITAFGWTGSYAHRPGVDPLAQALTGMQRAQGGAENRPVYFGAPTDYTCGALGALGTIIALFARERTGVAQRVDTNLLNSGVLLTADGFMKYSGKPPRRLPGKGLYGLGALHRLYETQEGWIYLIAESQREWETLCGALDRTDLPGDSRFATETKRKENDAPLADELGRIFKTHKARTLLARLRNADILCAPVVEGYADGFFSDPQVIANQLIVEQKHRTLGDLKSMGNLIKFANTTEPTAEPTPLLGEHTREVLREAGFSPEQIDQLYRQGIVKTED